MMFMPAVLLTAGIVVISLWESPKILESVSMSDKAMHGIMYVFLALAWMAPVSRLAPRRWSPYVYVCLAVTAFGVLMEALQRFCTLTRSGEMADVYADFIGAIIGVLIVGIWRLLSTISR